MTLAIQALALPLALFTPVLQGTPPCEITGTPLLDGIGGRSLAGLSFPSLTISEDRLLVSRTVYVEHEGVWQYEATLLTPETTSPSSPSTAIDGDTAIVGHPLNDDLVMNGGSVEIFVRDGTTWTLEARLYPPAPIEEGTFGLTVALDGDVALVGAPPMGAGGTVFVYVRGGTTWSLVAELQPARPRAGAFFGYFLAVSGDTALIGELAGEVFVFADEGGTWAQVAELGVADAQAIDLCGDTAVVGDGQSFAPEPASIRIFVRDSGSVWSEQAALPTPSSRNVALDGDVLLTEDVVDFLYLVVRAHVRGGTTWTQLAEVAPFSGDPVAPRAALNGNRLVFWAGILPSLDLYYAELPPFVAPGVAHRSGGTNPDSYNSTPAYIGQSLQFTVDLTTTGHDQALVFGFDSPFGLTLGGGQTLLCLDLLGSGGELINTGFHPGPVAEIELPVPNLLALGGFEVSTQALHAFGTVPFALSNAQDLVIGACF